MSLQRLGLLLGAIGGVIGVLIFVAQIGARIAAADFATIKRLEDETASIRSEFKEQLAVERVLQAQREAAIVQRLDSLRSEGRESEERLTKQISSILNILLQRGRDR